MKSIILCVLLLAAAQATLVQNHEYWYTAEKAIAKQGPPFDIAWNYCDLKCLYFEHYYKGVDFVWIDFNPGFFKPNFAACFVRHVQANGTATYALWNTVVTNNTWYNKYCGGDTANYWAQSQGANPTYTVSAIQGIGIGNYPLY